MYEVFHSGWSYERRGGVLYDVFWHSASVGDQINDEEWSRGERNNLSNEENLNEITHVSVSGVAETQPKLDPRA